MVLLAEIPHPPWDVVKSYTHVLMLYSYTCLVSETGKDTVLLTRSPLETERIIN